MKKESPLTIVWFRQDLRIQDNPALTEACKRGRVIPVYIWSPEQEGEWPLGAASKWWLHHSLDSLADELKSIGLTLVLREGKALDVLDDLIRETGADAVHWNRRYEPESIKQTAKVKEHLQKQGVSALSYNGSLLYEPWTIANKQGKPFQVFTPFWRACRASGNPLPPTVAPKSAANFKGSVQTLLLKDLTLLPQIPWDGGIRAAWNPGSPGARKCLNKFLKESISEYNTARDYPWETGVSNLSPHLHFGEISPRIIWQAVLDRFSDTEDGVECYLRQLGWREFAHHLLYHFPRTPQAPLRDDFNKFPWLEDENALKRWQKGLTGYPIVDAGMRELWHTGWMHNRVRMIVGSFLVKDLLISWVEGAKWFWDTLVDADLANNTMGWQWVGGCGADAAPYFRVFNPCTQGQKFDAEGAYVRKWVPELADMPDRWIHNPWEAPSDVLRSAGVNLGHNYPKPIVDHASARLKALEAFKNKNC